MMPGPEEKSSEELKPKAVARCTDEGWFFEADCKRLGPFSLQEMISAGFELDLASQLSVEPKDILTAKLKNYTRELGISELNEILSTTVKQDEPSKAITFLAMLMAQTEQDQYNIAFQAESSAGKSYIPLELVNYFPREEQRIYAGASPTSFFHEVGEWDKERKAIKVDLEGKILIFMDQPHWQLLEKLRPLLSHDRKTLIYKITDKREKAGLRTKTVEIIGYPSVLFCTAKTTLDDQERTRLWLLSPEVTQQKLLASLKLLTQKETDLEEFRKYIESHPLRNWLVTRVSQIRASGVRNIIIPYGNQILDRFLQRHSYLTPRDQRDYPRLLRLIKASALLNCFNRERRRPETITANDKDVEEGFSLYEKLAKSNELGISPETYRIYEEIIAPLAQDYSGQENGGINRKQICQEYFKHYRRAIASIRLRQEVLPALEAAGLILQEPDPNDKRQMLVYPTVVHTISEESSSTTQAQLPQRNSVENSGVDSEEKESLGPQELFAKLRSEFRKGTEQDFEDLAQKFGCTPEYASQLFDKLVEDGTIGQNPAGFWEWIK